MNKWTALLAWIAVLLILYASISAASSKNDGCPYEILGNPNASLTVKYFGSPFCVYCWIEEPILKDLVAEYPDNFAVEKYDVRYCTNETARYGIVGTPGHVFQYENRTKEHVQIGLIQERQWRALLCEMAGAC